MNESAEVSGEIPEEFVPDPKRNFLPHLVATAKVCRGQVKAVRELSDYGLYVTFFPAASGGAIERCTNAAAISQPAKMRRRDL